MKLDPLFCDNLIFAENMPVRVFGEGEGDVTVSFNESTKTVRAKDGKWLAELPACAPGGPYQLEINALDFHKVIKNVYVGQVYLIAGQSNAEFRLCESDEPETGYMSDELLRNYFVCRPWIPGDVFKPGDGWRTAEKDKVGQWSAVGYLAGRALRRETGLAIGTVSCYQGASIIESWMPAEEAAKFGLKENELMIDHTYPEYTAWNKGGIIYDSMLSKLFPFSFSGVIWYQGESDTTAAEGAVYDKELCRLMQIMRQGFADPELYFAIIQIADFDGRKEYDPEGWISIQKAQERAVESDPYSSLVISRDVCESSGIHPVKKTQLSERAAKVFY